MIQINEVNVFFPLLAKLQILYYNFRLLFVVENK